MHAPFSHLFDLQNRVALVTGAGRGLGLEMARALAQAGATVWLNGRDAASLNQAIAQCQAQGLQNVHAMPFDVADDVAASQALQQIMTQSGRLDILVNNVGQRDRREFDAFSLADIQRMLNVNLVAPLALSRAAASHMVACGSAQQKQARIVNITSIAGPISRAGDVAYTVAKGGLDAATRALAAEFGARGINVNAVAPGYFATEANQAMVADPDVAQWLGQRTSLGRWGKPSEIAGAVVFLASDAASYVTGQTLAVDGGYLSHF